MFLCRLFIFCIFFLFVCVFYYFFFFFQAEDGIRDWSVTGVQTCALPISQCLRGSWVTRGQMFSERAANKLSDLIETRWLWLVVTILGAVGLTVKYRQDRKSVV